MKIGILREGKVPIDRRVPFTPNQCALILRQYPDLRLVVQPSPIRCFPDEAYLLQGIELEEDMGDCDVLFGVKEVRIEDLLEGKTYFYFSHTHKLQPYNRALIQAILRKRIVHIDYECLTYPNGDRLIGFGRYAGLVGAYNGLKTYGEKYGLYHLKSAHQCHDLNEMIQELGKLRLYRTKIVLTGSGRVAKGAVEILDAAGIASVNPEKYLSGVSQDSVYTWIDADRYVARRDGRAFDLAHFYRNGGDYKSMFMPYARQSDVFIAGHYWDPNSPVFFTAQQAAEDDFRIRVIADISCDIGKPIASTLRASTIDDPVYDYDRSRGIEVQAYSDKDHISVMAVDNLPCELPIDASRGFGEVLLYEVLPLVIRGDGDKILQSAIFTNDRGHLTKPYQYMQSYVDGED